jgi:hypothetical protein
MPVERTTARKILGKRPLVLSAMPFHKGLKDLSDKCEEVGTRNGRSAKQNYAARNHCGWAS